MDISKLTHGAKLVLGGTIAVPDRLDLQLAGGRYRHRLRRRQHVARLGRPRRPDRDRDHRVGGAPPRQHEDRDRAHAGDGDARRSRSCCSSSPYLKFLVSNEFRTFWAWLGLLLAILIAVGAWVNMKQLGESVVGDGRLDEDRGGSAAAAAKAATDKGDDAPAAAPQPRPPLPPLRLRRSAPPPPLRDAGPRSSGGRDRHGAPRQPTTRRRRATPA